MHPAYIYAHVCMYVYIYIYSIYIYIFIAYCRCWEKCERMGGKAVGSRDCHLFLDGLATQRMLFRYIWVYLYTIHDIIIYGNEWK